MHPLRHTDREPAAHQATPPFLRRSRIFELVSGAGFMSVTDIAISAGVSEITIRRDLAALETDGMLRRTHGGAVPLRARKAEPFDLIEPEFEARCRRNMAAKERIAEAAAGLIAPGETLALDVGTTALALARALRSRTDVKVVTSNLRAAGVLADRSIDVYVPGGKVRGGERAIGGARAVAEISDHWFHTAVIGVSGVSDDGIFDYSPDDTEVKRAFIARASRVLVLADFSKFQRRALVRIAPLAAIQTIVTDRSPPARLAACLTKSKIRLVLAAPRSAPAA